MSLRVLAFALVVLSVSACSSTEATPECCRCMAFSCEPGVSEEACIKQCTSGSFCCRAVEQSRCQAECPTCKDCAR